jgi:hypothetical protein
MSEASALEVRRRHGRHRNCSLAGMSEKASRKHIRKLVPASPSAEEQPDKGYEKSHGYGPSHGGPTGPGDAPAKVPAKVPDGNAPPEPDEARDDDDDEGDS